MIDYQDLMARVEAARKAGPLEVKITDISHDVVTQIRAGVDQGHIDRIRYTITSGGAVRDPIELVRDGKRNYIWDGWHRKEAHAGAGCAYIDAYVLVGTHEEAIALACGANTDTSRSLPRSDDEEKNAIKTFRRLFTDDEWAKLPVSAVAEFCGLGRERVREIIDSTPILRKPQDTKLSVTRTRGDKTTTYEMQRPTRTPAPAALKGMGGAEQIAAMNAGNEAAILRSFVSDMRSWLPRLTILGPRAADIVTAIQHAISLAQRSAPTA